MFRILGFILGSAVSIAGIFFVLGVPEINLSSVESDQARFDAALEKIREKQPAVEEFVEKLLEDEPTIDDPADVVDATAIEVTLEDGNSPADVELFTESDVQPLTEPQDIFNPQLHWHEFWNPFRSEIAAQGFVSQLEKVTGLDYRVMKVETGVYQVGFAYSNDDERRIKIAQISAATGLDLPQT
jgi:hypothetical protein